MIYQVCSKDYLKRARAQLNKGTSESLFYAAFELRCGIEARLQQYLEVQDHISKKLKKGWQIVKLANNIEKIFKLGDKIVEVIIKNDEIGVPLHAFYYTPVSKKLKEMGKKLGELMHAMGKIRLENDNWWMIKRNFLENVYKELEKTNKGTLLGPPLMDKKTGHVKFMATPTKDRNDEIKDIMNSMPIGKTLVMQVKYLDNYEDGT